MAATGATTPDRRALTRAEVRTLALAALGGALEYYDFIIFVFFAATIGRLFFPADTPDWLRLLQTWGLFAAGYLGGALVLGAGFLYYAWLLLDPPNELFPMKVFNYSIVYLMALFAFLLIDHYVGTPALRHVVPLQRIG